jgi:hypothetical protein
MRGRLLLAALALLALAGCDARARSWYTGPLLHVSKTIDLDKADMVRVDLRMGAGELNVAGGSSRLLDADFAFGSPEQEPTVRYEDGSFRGRLTIAEPSHHFGGSGRYEWKLRLNNEVPMDLVTHLGAGNAEMRLGSLNLRGIEVHMGFGNLDMDLRGSPKRDYDVEIHGGVGNATVRLPAGVGIVAYARGGIGNIDVDGLEKHNGRWVSAQRENANVTVHLDIHGGIGNITLRAN